jgi:hypothetical protein
MSPLSGQNGQRQVAKCALKQARQNRVKTGSNDALDNAHPPEIQLRNATENKYMLVSRQLSALRCWR